MIPWTVVVPALHIPRADGTLDSHRTRDYAQSAAGSWVDRILINGSTTGGRELTRADREVILDIWLDAVGPDRLLACSWSWPDITSASDRNITPMAVMTPEFVGADALRWLGELPHATIYSHPAYGGPVWTPDLAQASAAADSTPLGGKVSKVSIDDVTDLHRAAPHFALWDGSARHIRQSLDAGAAGVVLTPLAGDLDRLPPKSVELIQKFVDPVQAQLDQISGKTDRRRFLLDRSKR